MELNSRRSYVSVRTASNRIERYITSNQIPSYEIIHVWDSHKRVLAEEIVSTIDIPAYDSSHMDGYAVKAEDIIHASQQTPAALDLRTNRVRPRTVLNFDLQKQEAFRITTGGYLPKGANTVVPIEQTWLDNKNKVQVVSSLPRGSFVYSRGRDIKKGHQVMKSGKILRPQDMGLLASLHITKVKVFRKPKVAIIATGSELTNKLENIRLGKVLDTHSHIISGLVEELGGSAFRMGITADDIAKIRNKIESAMLKSMDLILTLGGSSVGKYDLVEAAINSIGKPDLLFHGIKLDRGRVTGLGITKGKPIIIMPGPIQGAINAFIVFAYPLLKLLSGQLNRKPLSILSTMTEEWYARKKFSNFTKIIYVNLRNQQNGEFEANPVIGETETMTILTKSNGYIIADEKTTHIKAGEKVKVQLLPGLSYTNDQFELS
jgi:molybdenum cofactor synthesis domain-containing protein